MNATLDDNKCGGEREEWVRHYWKMESEVGKYPKEGG